MEHDGITFLARPGEREYDWLVVYDDFPKQNVGSIRWEREPLACPAEQTILITAEPPTIKLYPRCYTKQFGYVLTTHDEKYLPHRNRRLSDGSMQWIVDYTAEQVFSLPSWEKSKIISTCCSTKNMKHTQHYNRLKLVRYLAEHMPELDWYGHGKHFISSKQTALNDYKYHVAVENYIHPHHWSDKVTDPSWRNVSPFTQATRYSMKNCPRGPSFLYRLMTRRSHWQSSNARSTTVNTKSGWRQSAKHNASSPRATTCSHALPPSSVSTRRLRRALPASNAPFWDGTDCAAILFTRWRSFFCCSVFGCWTKRGNDFYSAVATEHTAKTTGRVQPRTTA